jgi:membrane-bound lytic murein transglycosylase F
MRFALAAYNVGLGHVLDARRLAAREGMDPDKWFGNVENALLLLSQKKYAARARHGYCRGGQPVAYVAHIQSLYDAYVRVTE